MEYSSKNLTRRDFIKTATSLFAYTTIFLTTPKIYASENFKRNLSKAVNRIIDNGKEFPEERYSDYSLNLPEDDKVIDFSLRKSSEKGPRNFLEIEYSFNSGEKIFIKDYGLDGKIQEGKIIFNERRFYTLTDRPTLLSKFNKAYETAVDKLLERYPLSKEEEIEEIFKRIK